MVLPSIPGAATLLLLAQSLCGVSTLTPGEIHPMSGLGCSGASRDGVMLSTYMIGGHGPDAGFTTDL